MVKLEMNYEPKNNLNGESYHYRVTECNITEFLNALIGENIVISESDEITIHFSYPMKNPVDLTFNTNTNFKITDILKLIYRGYRKIYDEESDAIESIDNEGTLKYNRGSTDGKYGIYLHDPQDLFIEGIKYFPNEERIELEIGS